MAIRDFFRWFRPLNPEVRNHNTIPVLSAAERRTRNIFSLSAGSPNRRHEATVWDDRRIARALADCDPLISKYLETVANFVVGENGYVLEPNFPSSARIKAAWDRWANRNVSATGGFSLHDLSAVIIKKLARDGEVLIQFVVTSKGFKLLVRDPALLDEQYFGQYQGRQIVNGVEFDDIEPVAYWMWNRYPDDYQTNREQLQRIRIDAKNMLHLFENEEGGLQIRGKTWLSPVLDIIERRYEYRTAYLQACNVAANAPLAIESVAGLSNVPPNLHLGQTQSGPNGNTNGQQGSNDLINLDYSAILHLPPGKTLKSVDIKFPTTSLKAVLEPIDHEIASGLHIGYSTLTGHLGETNYAGAKFGSLDERAYWSNVQAFFARLFMQRVYEEWLSWAVFTGQVSITRDLEDCFDVSWRGPAFKSGDPLKDAQALSLLLQNNCITREQIANMQGNKFEDVVAQLKKEKEMLEAAGLSTATVVLKPLTDKVVLDQEAEEVTQGKPETQPDAPKETQDENKDAESQ